MGWGSIVGAGVGAVGDFFVGGPVGVVVGGGLGYQAGSARDASHEEKYQKRVAEGIQAEQTQAYNNQLAVDKAQNNADQNRKEQA